MITLQDMKVKRESSDKRFTISKGGYKAVYPSKPIVRPLVWDVFPSLPEHPQDISELMVLSKSQVKLLKRMAKIWGIYLSPYNGKVLIGGLDNGYNRPVAFGKTAVASCMYASDECKVSCYQMDCPFYRASKSIHIWNTLFSLYLTINEYMDAIQLTLDRMRPDLIRLLDSGDFMIAGEFKAWDIIAKRNPNIRIYGYTKAGELLAKCNLNPNEGVVWNLSDNGDAVSKEYSERLHSDGFKVCHIQYTTEYNDSIPFNNEEQVAMLRPDECQERYNTRRFQIGYHGNVHSEVSAFYEKLEQTLTVKVC